MKKLILNPFLFFILTASGKPVGHLITLTPEDLKKR
jgi:hypothetical protein